MLSMLRSTLMLSVLLTLIACGGDDALSAVANGAVSAGDDHFTLTVSGPRLDGDYAIVIPAARITGELSRDNLDLRYTRGAADESAVTGMTLAMTGPDVEMGGYNLSDERVTFQLRGLTDKDGQSLDLDGDYGSLFLSAYAPGHFIIKGTVNAYFSDPSTENDIYEVTGSFELNRSE